MPRLPDQFDLWVRRARQCPDPARQIDYVMGALAAQKEWHFLNIGTGEAPRPAEAEIEGEKFLLIFTDTDRVEEIMEKGALFPVITIPTAAALAWCIERPAGLLINPGEYAVTITLSALKTFHDEWRQRDKQATGFWIPNLTTEEEDFWQEHGL